MRRLSIIDVAGGHQPMTNEDGSVHVVFNGEIYNHHALRGMLERRGHVFRTRSDTETLVHLYEDHGAGMVEHLRGMYAFALWDERQTRLLLARDRLGIKPLSYWLWDDKLLFCSELRSLIALDQFPRELDRAAVGAYLAFGYVPDPASIFRGVRKLPPGHLLTWTAAEGTRVERYWSPVAAEVPDVTEHEAVTELRRLLAEAVTSHLEAEVPLGAFLSGGLDSSTVVSLMMSQGRRRVRTFSIGFDEDAYNEAPVAASVAAALGTDHTELIVRPNVDALFNDLVAVYDEPFGDSSAVPTYLVAQLARRDVTVALSGDGGDELFGGYTRYLDVLARREWPAPVRALLGSVGRALPHIAFGKNRLMDLGRRRHGRYVATVALPLSPAEGGVAPPDIVAQVGPFEHLMAKAFQESGQRDFTAQMSLVDMLTYLPGDILTKVDRASMAVSLEARVPLLDHPLVEFAAGLPTQLKFRHGRGKHVFREAIRAFVPPEVLQRPKLGFAVPLARWFRGPLRHRIDELLKQASPIRDYVMSSAVRRIAGEHLVGRRDHSTMLWRLLVLDLWLEHLAAGRLALPQMARVGEPARREAT
jgi:asparagine synthase (glutamine-hydrolysing)